jgi:iron complex transport system ATP-binding protein
MNSVIELHAVGLALGGKDVLTDVSLRITKNDFFVIIGPNGAGKTSLLRIISGLQKKNRGDVHINGRELAAYSRRQLARLIATVPQQLQTDFPFTVVETVLMGRAPHLSLLRFEGKDDMEIAESAMQRTEIAHLAYRRLDQLSGGERQRVIIARALCQQPAIMLLDEPTASLDPAHQLKIMDLMERLRLEQNITILMVSHDLNLAAMYGTRLLLLKDGRAVQEGSPEEVLSPERLFRGYGCRMLVDKNPASHGPRVNLVPEKYGNTVQAFKRSNSSNSSNG